MIEVPITKEQIDIATKLSKEMGVLKNSIEKGDGTVAGFIGELVFCEFFKAIHDNTYDYDAVINGITVDVKTKRCNSEPLVYYNASVAAYNTKQKCDYYYFVRVNNEYTKAWLLGKCRKDRFYKESVFYKKGEIDPDSPKRNPWRFKDDCYNITISRLKEI
jgi:hypothetical protein